MLSKLPPRERQIVDLLYERPFQLRLHGCARVKFINAVLKVIHDRLRTHAFLLPAHKGPLFLYYCSSI